MNVAQSHKPMPAPIARAWAEYEQESHAFRKLHRLIDTYEALLKYAAVLAVQNFHAAGLAEAFPDTDRLIRDRVMRPMLGDWAGFLREVLRCFAEREGDLFCRDLFLFHFRRFKARPAIQRHFSDQGAAGRLLTLRNTLAHGATLPDDDCHARLDEHEPHLRVLLGAATFLADLPLLYVEHQTEEGAFRVQPLMGEAPESNRKSEISNPSLVVGHVFVQNPQTDAVLDLHPLLLYTDCVEEILQWDDAHECIVGKAACQRRKVLFFNDLRSEDRIQFLDYWMGHHSRFRSPHPLPQEFRARFPRPPRSEQRANYFEEFIREQTKHFVGRESELGSLDRFVSGSSRRVAVVVGAPGMGKSALLARWVEQHEAIRHFIREGDAATYDTLAIFRNLALQLSEHYGVDWKAPRQAEPTAYRQAFEATLKAAVERGGPVVLVIDGLDEALRALGRGRGMDSVSTTIVDYLPDPSLLPEAVKLILSTRPELLEHPAFSSKFERDKAEHLELSRLGDADVRALLYQVRSKYEVLEAPAYVEAIVERSEGSPLYVRMLLEDLAERRLTFGQIEQLPQGVVAYFERILEFIEGEGRTREMPDVEVLLEAKRATLSALVAQGILPKEQAEAQLERERAALEGQAGVKSVVLLALYCLAKEPLVLKEAAAILGADLEEAHRAFEVIRTVLVGDGTGRFAVFHTGFRDYFVNLGDYAEDRVPRHAGTIERVQEKIVAYCSRWPEHQSAYALRFGVEHLADAAIHCLKDAENRPDNAAKNEEHATSYVNSIVSLLSDGRFHAARTGIGLGIAAQANDAQTGLVAALVLGHRSAASALLRILIGARTSASAFQDLKKTVEAAVPDPQAVIRALAPFHPPEQAALALWFAVRLDERGLEDAAVNLIDWAFTNHRESLAAWPAEPLLEAILRTFVQRARLELAREFTMRLAQTRGFGHPAWPLLLYDRSADKTDLQKAIDALTSGRLPDSVPVGVLWENVVWSLAKHPEMQPETMRWWLSHDYAGMACEATMRWLSEGARLEDLPIEELLEALGEADDANQGMGLAALAAGLLYAAGTAQEVRKRLAVLAALGRVSSQVASAWMESAFWRDNVDSERAVEYVDFLLDEIGPLIDDEETRNQSVLSLACEVAAHARWAALKESGTEGEPASCVSMYLSLLPRIEERLSPAWKPICRAILDLTVEWGEEAPGLDSATRRAYRRARRVPTDIELIELAGRLARDEDPQAEQVDQIIKGHQHSVPDETLNAIYARARKRPNSIALKELQERLGWLYEDDPNDEYGCNWIDGWLRRNIKYGKERDRSKFVSLLDEELTSRGLEVKLELQRVFDLCMVLFKVLPAPILLHVADHVVRLSKDLLGWKHELGCKELDHARTIAAIDLLEPAGALPCSQAFLSPLWGVDCRRLRRWSPTGWIKMPARRIIQQLAGIGDAAHRKDWGEYHIKRLGTVLGSAVERHPELVSLIETLLEQASTMKFWRRGDAIAALGAALLRAAGDPNERARAVALLVEHKALDELLEEARRSGDPTLARPILDLLRRSRDRRQKLPELVGALIAHGHDTAAEQVVSEVLLSEAGNGDEASNDDQNRPWERARSLVNHYMETVSAGGQVDEDVAAEMEENPFVVHEIVNAVLGSTAGNTDLVLEFLVLEPERQAAFRAELQTPEVKENWAELVEALPARCKRSMVEPLCRAALLTGRRDLADAAAKIAQSADDSKSAECLAWAMLGLGDGSAARHWATVFVNRGGGVSNVLGAVGDLDLAAKAFAASALGAEDPWEKLDKLLDRTSFGETGFKFPYLGISEADALVTFLHLLADQAPVADEDLECFSPDALRPAWFVRLPDHRAFRLGDLGWKMIERSLASRLDVLAAAWAELVLRWAFARVPSLPSQTEDSGAWDWLKRSYAADYLRVVGFAAGLRSQSWRDEHVEQHVSAAFFLAGRAAKELGRWPFYYVLEGLDKAGRWGTRSDYEEIVERVAREKAYGARLAYAEYCAEAGRKAEAHEAFADLLRGEEPGFLHIRAADAFRDTSDKIGYLRIALGEENQDPEYVGQLVEATLELDQDGDQILDELQARHAGTSCEGAIALARTAAILKKRPSPAGAVGSALDLLARARSLIKCDELPSFGFRNAGELEELLTDKWVDVVLSALDVEALTPEDTVVLTRRILSMASSGDLISSKVQSRLVDLACRAMSTGSQGVVSEMATKLLDVESVDVETAVRLLLADTSLASDVPRRLLMKVIQSSDNQDEAAREAIRALAKTAGMESLIEECYRMIAGPEQALLARDDIRAAQGDSPIDRVEALATHAIEGDDFRSRFSELAEDAIQQMPETSVERREKLARILLRYVNPKVLLDAVKVDAGQEI